MKWTFTKDENPVPGIPVFVIDDGGRPGAGRIDYNGYWQTIEGRLAEQPVVWAYPDIVETVRSAQGSVDEN